MANQIKEPQHSMKYNDHLQLLLINVNLPKCPERFISVQTDENKGMKLNTGKFTVKFQLELTYPDDIVVYNSTLRQHFNGNLLKISIKAHKVGEGFVEAHNANKINELVQQGGMKEEYEQKRLQLQQEEVKQEKLQTKMQQLMKVEIGVNKPIVLDKEHKQNNLVNKRKTRIISNILTEKRTSSENELMLKLARKAQKSQHDKEMGKVEKIERKEQMILQQIEAKHQRQEMKLEKKKAVVQRIQDKKDGKK